MSAPRSGVAAIAAAVRAGTTRARDVIDATLADIAARDGAAHAFVTVVADAARRDAAAVDDAVGRGVAGPLAGVPIAVKDLLAVRGVVRSNGCPVFADDAPQTADATAVARVRAAGAVVVGTTHMHEMALGPTGVNPAMGSAVNPWAAERVPGGSSSGSGVAVAAGLVPAALGSDTGGSVRLPAAFCGITGFKPTYGRVSRAGATPLAWTLDHVGPMTRSAEDAALLLQVLAGADPADATTAPLPVPDYVAALDRPVRGWRVGVLRRYAFADIDPAVAHAVDAAIAHLRALGVAVVELDDADVEDGHTAFAGVIMTEASAALGSTLGRRLGDASFELQMFVQLGRALQGRHYLAAQRQRTRTYAAVRRLFERVDLLLLPTTVCPAPRPDEQLLRIGARDYSAMEAIAFLTWAFNFTGLPAISVPCGFTADRLPIGLQLAGRPFADADVLTLAHAYQRATDWHRAEPPR